MIQLTLVPGNSSKGYFDDFLGVGRDLKLNVGLFGAMVVDLDEISASCRAGLRPLTHLEYSCYINRGKRRVPFSRNMAGDESILYSLQ